MIIEAFKIVSSVFPFIKEAFLWREGADANKPVTAADLRKRKFAVFLLFASLVVNYLTVSKLYESHVEHAQEQQDKKIITDKLAQATLALQDQAKNQVGMVPAASCVSPRDIFDMVNHQVDAEIKAGILMHVPPDKTPAKHR